MSFALRGEMIPANENLHFVSMLSKTLWIGLVEKSISIGGTISVLEKESKNICKIGWGKRIFFFFPIFYAEYNEFPIVK